MDRMNARLKKALWGKTNTQKTPLCGCKNTGTGQR